MHKLLSILLFLSVSSRAEETLIASVMAPNRWIPQSEIQLLQVDDGAIVRSIIDTRFPDKVLKKITTSEKNNWQENEDMQQYIQILTQAFTEYKQRRKNKSKENLIIDFITTKERTRIDFFFDQETWKTLSLSPEYIRKNQEFILIDVFGEKAEEQIQKLKKIRDKEPSK